MSSPRAIRASSSTAPEDAAGAYAPLTRVFEQLALASGAAVRW